MRHQSLTKTQVSVRLSIAALATLLFVLALGLQSPRYLQKVCKQSGGVPSL